MTEQGIDVAPARRGPSRTEVLDTLMGLFSVGCIVGGAVYGIVSGNWLVSIFLAAVAIWVEVGD